MSCPKRKLDVEPDPDYEDNRAHETKRLRRLEENAKAGLSQKLSSIIIREFDDELSNKEKEVKEIQERLYAAQKTLHLLRYVVVSSYFRSKQSEAVGQSGEQPKRIHPAIKKLLGKEPRLQTEEPLDPRPSRRRPVPVLVPTDTDRIAAEEKPPETMTKVPRYIPPKSSGSASKVEVKEPRGIQLKVKRRLVIGNISKWIPIDTREDDASHKWMMYVRGPKEAPDISGFVSKVRFFLHPSYRPHDVVDICTHPFHLARRGWGEFPVRVQIHFMHPLNKPVDIIHQLKLDQTRTGLQTLGAETVVDIWLHRTEAVASPNTVDEDCPRASEANSVVIEQTTAANSAGVTLYEEDGHRTIVHDMSFVAGDKVVNQRQDSAKPGEFCGEVKIKQEMEEYGNINENLDQFNHNDQFVDSEIKVKEEFPDAAHDLMNDESEVRDRTCASISKSVDTVHSLDHDYISPSIPQRLSDSCLSPPEELVIGEEVVVSSSCDFNTDLNSTQMSSSHQPSEMNKHSNSLEQINHVNSNDSALLKLTHPQESENGRIIKNIKNSIISPSKSIPSYVQSNAWLSNIKSARVEGNNGVAKLNVVNNSDHSESASPVSKLSSFNNQNNVEAKIPPLGNMLSKPTTLVKCMDKSGNVFYITVGVPNTKTHSKISGNLLGKTVPTVVNQMVARDLKSNSTISLLPNSLLSKENHHVQKLPNPLYKGKLGNPENLSQFIPVNSPVMKSLITQKTSVLSSQKIPPSKSLINNVHNAINTISKQSQPSLFSGRIGSIMNKSILTPEVSNSILSAKTFVKPSSSSSNASMLEGITSVDCSASSEKLQSSLLVKPNLKVGHKLSQNFQVSSDVRTLLSSKCSPKGNTHLNHQSQGQSLLFLKDGQIFLLKQSSSVLQTSTNVKQSLATVKREEMYKNHSSVLLPPVTNSAIIPPRPIKLNQLASGTRTLLNCAKPGVSLLKKNAVSVKTELAEEQCEDAVKKEREERLLEEQRLLFSGRTLVLNKANSRVVVSPKRPKFEDDLQEAISHCKFDDVQKSVSWLLRHFPLVHPDASHPEFRVLHPYCAPSEATFLQWNHGKRKASEWLRAKAVQQALRVGGILEEEIWSTRNIAVWARLHAHTPLPTSPSALTDVKSNMSDLEQTSSKCSATYSEPVKIMEWLEANQEANRGSLEDDVEVDVVRLSPAAVRVKEEPEPLEELSVMDVSPPDLSDCVFVRETARELGIKFPPEQVVPGVLYCAAERILVQAMRSFMEDILRRSLRKSWERSLNNQPDSITLNDTREAILDRPEFDMFTNIGLGVQAADTG